MRRAYPNCFGWPVIEHLTEHHFGPSAKEHKKQHGSEAAETSNAKSEHWDREYLQSDASEEDEGSPREVGDDHDE